MATESAMQTLSNIKEKDKRVIKSQNNRRLENLFCLEQRGNSPTYTENYDKINWEQPKDVFEETKDHKGRQLIIIKKD